MRSASEEAVAACEFIAVLYATAGKRRYGESVSQVAHALQCAALAESESASPELIAAALLHDIGHLIDRDDGPDEVVAHEYVGASYLNSIFGIRVAEPVRLHVDAKRYLCGTVHGYQASLSKASQQSLQRQGGAMSQRQCERFAGLPFAQQSCSLRRWDDAGKVEGIRPSAFQYYLPLLRELAHAHLERKR